MRQRKGLIRVSCAKVGWKVVWIAVCARRGYTVLIVAGMAVGNADREMMTAA